MDMYQGIHDRYVCRKPVWLSTLLLVSASLTCILAEEARGQVTPDNTLGRESSIVTPIDVSTDRIDGGAIRDINLFHSFENFSIETEQSLYFTDPEGVENIFGRVTGNNRSDIFGTLGVLGNANLFLINPQGVFFGPEASLDVLGSFQVSTANEILFPDGSEFSALNPEAVPLLTVNVTAPTGIKFSGATPGTPVGDLTNQANLTLPPGQDLTLHGNTTLTGGTLSTEGGIVQVLGNQVGLTDQARIDVSAETDPGTVRIGGSLRGEGDLLTATQTYVGPDVEITANTTSNGDGGEVVVWAEEVTGFYGKISAQGGNEAGNGGFVEVSGQETLIFEGLVDVAATNGEFGTLLLDPDRITISNQPSSPDGVNTSLPDIFETEFADQDIVINASILMAQPGNIELVAIEEIQVDQALVLPGSVTLTVENSDGLITSDDDFSLTAVGDITINGRLEVAEEISLVSQEGGIFAGRIAGNSEDDFFSVVEPVTSVQISALSDIDVGRITAGNGFSGGTIVLESANGTINAADLDSTSGGNNSNSGNIIVNAQNDITIGGPISTNSEGFTSGDVEISSEQGAITINQDILTRAEELDFFGTPSSSAGDITLQAPNGNLSIANIDARSTDSDGGDLTLEASGNINSSGLIRTSGENGGNIVIGTSSTDSINIQSLETNEGGQISLLAEGNIQAEDISSNSGNSLLSVRSLLGDAQFNNADISGPIAIYISSGQLLANTISSSGSDINVLADTEITVTDSIDSSDGDGGISGDILLDSEGILSIQDATVTTGGNGDVFITNGVGNILLNEVDAIDLTVEAAEAIEGNGVLIVSGDANFTSNVADAGSVSITNIGDAIIGNSIIGGNLTVTSSELVGQLPGETIQVAGSIAEGESTSLANTAGITPGRTMLTDGTVVITEVGTVDLKAETFSNSLTVNSLPRGVVQFNDVLEQPAITLNQANQFSGTLRFNTAVGPDSVVVEAMPGITQSGPVSVTEGITRLNAGFGNIVLTNTENNFRDLAIVGDTVVIDEQDGFNLLGSVVDGNLDITTGGMLTQSAPLTVAGETRITTTLSEAGQVNLQNLEPTRLGNTLIGGDFILNSEGEVSQVSGSLLQVAGTVFGFDITGFNTDAPIIAVSPSSDGNQDVVIVEVGPIDVSDRLEAQAISNVSGNLTVTSLESAGGFFEDIAFDVVTAIELTEPNRLSGPVSITTDAPAMVEITGTPDILQTDEIAVSGTANFNAEGGSVVLDAPGNTFGQLGLRTDAATIAEQDGTELLRSEIAGNFTLITGGEVTQAGDLTVLGESRFINTQPDAPILLTEDNQLVGAIFFETTGTGDIALTNILGTTVLGASNLLGNLEVAANGEVTQTGALQIAGTTILTAEGVDLPEANDFNVLTVEAGDRLNLRDTNNLRIRDSQLITRDSSPSNIDLSAQGQLILNNTQIVARTSSGISNPVQLSAQQLDIQNGSTVLTAADGNGQAGNLMIEAQEISLSGEGDAELPSVIGSLALDQGQSGNITVNTGNLLVTDGGLITTATLSERLGGNITVNADTVQLVGLDADQTVPSAISADTFGMGDGGNVIVNTDQLLIEEGAIISTSTFAEGKGGGIQVNADNIQLIGESSFTPRNSSTLSARTFGSGTGGTIDIIADTITLEDTGTITTSSRRTLGPASFIETELNLIQRIENDFEQLEQLLPGTLDTVKERIAVIESIDVPGDAGDINLTADLISLIDIGEIFSQSRAEGDGGNIELTVKDLLLLRNGSLISTTAGTENAGGNGGKITINAENGFVLGIREENSDIIANAFTGNGGIINITTNAIFGLEFRSNLTPLSDITATSTGGGIDGTVDLNTLDIDPAQALSALPDEPVDPEIVDSCQARNVRSDGEDAVEFLDLGRGGTPIGPDDVLESSSFIEDWIDLDFASSTERETALQGAIDTQDSNLLENRLGSSSATRPIQCGQVFQEHSK